MQNVNLLDARWASVNTKRAPPLAVLGAGALACAAVAVACHGVLEQRRLTQALAEQHRAQASAQSQTEMQSQTPSVAPGAPGAAAPTEPEFTRQSLAQREALLAALQRETPGPSHPAQTLISVVQALPATVWLNGLELRGEHQLRITGGTLEPQALAAYAHQLARAPSLRGIALKTVRLEAVAEPSGQHRFELASAVPDGVAP